ncbi:hypothetical protein K492DRAFT_38257 [Lichtheimia hyalospora FSU 10163]|nr:hypothetical protein K492DRAFT_38257 [Lichtheimia hyalospora FSU 10163]
MGVQMSKQRLNGGVATSDRRKKKKSSRNTHHHHHHHHPRQPTTSTSATTFDHHSKTFNDKLSHRSMSSTTTSNANAVNGHVHHHAFATDGPLSTLSSAIQSPTSPKRTRWTTAGSSSNDHPHHHYHNRSHVAEMDHRSMASCKSEDSAQAPSIASTASVERTASVTSQPESVTFDRNDEQEYNR